MRYPGTWTFSTVITTRVVEMLTPLNMVSVAEVLFRTALENQNRQNRTVKFGSDLFSPKLGTIFFC